MRKPVYAICQQQRSRSDCSSAQSDQHHFVRCLHCIIPILSKIKMSRLLLVSGWAGQFESYLVANPRRQVFSWHGSYHKNDKHYIVWSECSLVCIYTPYMIWAAAWQNQRKGMCAQRRLRSAWASAQSDQSLLSIQWEAKDPRYLHVDSKDWSDWVDAQADLSILLGAQFILSCCSSFVKWTVLSIWLFSPYDCPVHTTVLSIRLFRPYEFCPYNCSVIRLFCPNRMDYRKNLKYLDTWKSCCNHTKIWTWLYHWVMRPEEVDGTANSVDPDQSDLGLH